MHADLDPRPSLGRRLSQLPDGDAPPYGFAEFERRCGERIRAAQGLAGGYRVAAGVVLALGILALWIRLGGGPVPGVRPDAGSPALPNAHGASMERWLDSLPKEPAVVRVGTRAAVTGLEDRIAQLDDLLSVELLDEARPAQLLALQQERTRLVGALVQVRYAETLADDSR
jgi:hypothetical protein